MHNVIEHEQTYVLGHADSELQRLITQARFYGDLSEQALRMAGIAPGMHVLDLGCGSGDVTFLRASLVGPTGSVTGVDTSDAAIDLARQRAADAGLVNVTFAVDDIMAYRVRAKVDAVVGRLILIHMPDPVATLSHVTTLVKPGGLVMFEELDCTRAYSVPESPLFTTGLSRVIAAFERAGLDPNSGLRLYGWFRQAGLAAPQMIGGVRVESGPDSGVYQYLAETTRTLLPVMVKTGIATAEEIGIETFADRLRAEITEKDSVIVTPTLISAWARVPTHAYL